MENKCLWCLKNELEVTFTNKAHTIPKSLGGQHYNNNVCDECNAFFGSKITNNFSIEEALKEAFNISRRQLIDSTNTKRQVGEFKSRFFEIRERNGKKALKILPSFRLNPTFQRELFISFKRGLYKMYFEELNRQKGLGYEEKYNAIREFARYNKGNPPLLYFNRLYGIMLLHGREAETPRLIFDRMNYLYSNEYFDEIEFLGHVFGFPKIDCTTKELETYKTLTIERKKGYFRNLVFMEKITDMDIALRIMNQ